MKKWFSFAAGRIEYMPFEWWIMRAGTAWLAWSATPIGFEATAQPSPVGIAKFCDLTWMGNPENFGTIALLVNVFALLFAVGLAPLLSAAGLFVLHVSLGTLANSQGGGGGSHHATNIVGLVLLGQILGVLYQDFRAVRRDGWSGPLRARRERLGWIGYLLRHPSAIFRRAANHEESAAAELRRTLIYTTQQIIACAYVVSGISKLWRSEGAWLSEVKNIPLQFEKNRMNEYHDTLVMPAATTADRIAEWVGNHPVLAGGFFGAGLFLELFAFLGLWNRRVLALFGLGLTSMHLLISELMNLDFACNEWGLLFYWVNVPFWIWALTQTARHRRQRAD